MQRYLTLAAALTATLVWLPCWAPANDTVPVKKDDDDKRGGVRDSGGTTWWIATKIR